MAKIESTKVDSRNEVYKTTPSSDVDEPTNKVKFIDVYGSDFLSALDLPASSTAPGWSGSNSGGNDVIRPAIDDKPPSMHNPYFNIRLVNPDGNNYPLHDEDTKHSDNTKMFDDITVFDLIDSPRNASIYSPEDFLYLKNYDMLPLNRLITFRRFAHPTFDDIFSSDGITEPDIARMLTYFDKTTNKLSELLSFSAGLRWKTIASESAKAHMEGGNASGISGIAGKIMQVVDPKYGNEAMMGSARVNYDPQHDQNKVYGPVDSIANVHIRDVGMDFTQDMTINFAYEMKSHNGINQKAAFMDLMANIIMTITNDAKFWGGARYWVGPRPSSYMNMLRKFDSTDWNSFVTKADAGVKDAIGHFSKPGNAKAMLQNILNNAANMALGKLLNTLGRVGIPVMNSLLSGNPVGMWHLTVGNPFNPIMVAGDLIIENATVSFGDELGYDDFPTEIFVTITVKHAKPRGRAEIENMFNCGKGRIYLKPKDVLRKNASNTSSKENPVNANTVSEPTTNKFGNFDKSAIERNSRDVWSFMGDK